MTVQGKEILSASSKKVMQGPVGFNGVNEFRIIINTVTPGKGKLIIGEKRVPGKAVILQTFKQGVPGSVIFSSSVSNCWMNT